ncbi:hypothetical protein D9M70_457130 [compost metagenome]
MDNAIKRAVERKFPELAGGYHLPRFARVLGVADAPAGGALCDEFRPRYAVDLQVLREDGEPDQDLPVLSGVPLPLPIGGEEMGLFAFPAEGTTAVVCFAYGLPSKPYIQTILPHGLGLPRVPQGDQVWQHSDAAQQRVDAAGNWTRQTDMRIRDEAFEREVEADSNHEHYNSSKVVVDEHATELVAGIKTLQAIGALKLLSGGSVLLAALDGLNIATGSSHTLSTAENSTQTIGGALLERIQTNRISITQQMQRLQAAQTWIGSESINLLQILADLLDLVTQMNEQIAVHVHPQDGKPPVNAGAFGGMAGVADGLNAQLSTIKA